MRKKNTAQVRHPQTSTEMSVVDTHAVVLKYEGEKGEAEEKGTKIKGYRLETLKTNPQESAQGRHQMASSQAQDSRGFP